MPTSTGGQLVIRVTREIAAPDERVWALLVDWQRQGAWIPATTVRVLPGPSEGVGTRLEAITGLGPLRFVDLMDVDEWEPPRWCVVRHVGRLLRGSGSFRIEPIAADRCAFTWIEELEPPVRALAAVSPALGASAKPFFALALWRLDRLATGATAK